MQVANTVRSFDLNPTQALFVDAMEPKYLGFFGGIGNGKSFAGVVKVDLLCEAYPGNVILMARKDLIDLKRTTVLDFFSWRPDLKARYNQSMQVVTYPNGSQIVFRDLRTSPGCCR